MIRRITWAFILLFAFGLFAMFVFLFYARITEMLPLEQEKILVCWTTVYGVVFILLHGGAVTLEEKGITKQPKP
jgi:hypothetical protein